MHSALSHSLEDVLADDLGGVLQRPTREPERAEQPVDLRFPGVRAEAEVAAQLLRGAAVRSADDDARGLARQAELGARGKNEGVPQIEREANVVDHRLARRLTVEGLLEHGFLRRLIAAGDEPVSTRELLRDPWGLIADPNTNRVAQIGSSVRRKVGPLGYALEATPFGYRLRKTRT